MVLFAVQKLLSFTRSHLLVVNPSVCANGVLFRKSSFNSSVNSRRFPTLSMRFSVCSFMLSLVHLDLSIVQGDKYASVWILVHLAIQFDQHHLLKMLSFFQCVFLAS